MLGLPGMDPDRDLRGFRHLWEDPEYRPDLLKIYPTLVLPGTALFDDWKAGRYSPYDTLTAAALLARMKREIPPWVRIQRIQRDIPARLIAAGVRASNLRQLALRRLATEGRWCRCLRCREAGRRSTPPPDAFQLTETTYPAGGGSETFFAWEDPSTDTVAGFLRLRFPSDRTPGGLDGPVVRELKVVGAEVPVGVPGCRPTEYQHRGLGRALLDRAEERARSTGFHAIFVTSAVGTRPYYRARGFERAGPHMTKVVFAGHKA
jgi:elongator complex protein 3